MKVIWIIDHYSSEPKYGGIQRQFDFANELSKRGYKTVIISSSYSHYTHSYISEEDCYISRFSENAFYAYVKTSPYLENSGVGRMKNMFSFVAAVDRNRKSIADELGKPDVVVGASIHPLTWIAAYKAAKKYNVRFIAEVRDLWPETFVLSGEKKRYDPMVIFFGCLEKWAYKKADRIIYSMLYGDRYICDKLGFPKDKAFLIGQPMDCESYDQRAEVGMDQIPADIKEFIQNGFLCVFTGYYQEYEGVYVMLETAKGFQERDIPIKMLFVGSGPEYQGMKNYVAQNGLKNVFVGGRVSKESIPALLRQADVCMACCAFQGRKDALKYGVSKNKVNEYMYSKACIVYGRDDPGDPVATSGAGYVVEPFDTSAYASAIEKFYNMTAEERAKFGENGCRYVFENHKVDVLTDKLVEVLGV